MEHEELVARSLAARRAVFIGSQDAESLRAAVLIEMKVALDKGIEDPAFRATFVDSMETLAKQKLSMSPGHRVRRTPLPPPPDKT